MIINARSPYIITVNESGQIGSQIKLYISDGFTPIPVTATYTLSKKSPSASQIRTDYNISQFVREYIFNVSSYDITLYLFANVKVERYKEVALGEYVLLTTETFIAVNGYSLYSQGVNASDADDKFYVLANPNLEIQYNETISSSDYPFIDAAIDFTTTSGSKMVATYKDLNGRNEVNVNYLATDWDRLSVIKVPVRTSSTKFDNGNTVTIKYMPNGTTVLLQYTFTVKPICEPKYTPVVCQFINRFGGWQYLTFFKAKSNSLNVTSTSFNVLPDAVNYNPKKPQTSSLNINGRQSIKLNTGWVPENYSELIQDLLLSETILLDDVPVTIKTQSTDIKTSLKDKNINYEIEFEYAFNLINNVI